MKKLLTLALQNKHVTQSIVCKKSSDSTDIYLKGIIDAEYGVSASNLRAAFDAANGADVSLHINSPGGDVFEAREMQAIIASYPGKVTAVVEGLAASAGTIVAISCSEVHMLAGSRFMIHNGMTIAFGNKSDMQSAYDLLNGFDVELASEYAKKTKGDADQMTAWMDSETWFNADSALAAGFVDKVLPNNQSVSNEWDLSAYKVAPEKQEPAPPAAPPEKIDNQHRERQLQRLKLANHATRQ
ncbi:MAG: Clp protease ClpP [Betaproteobacteria bacterium]|nr:MAG: Clp protease ClpP [Betaproteobacteria bacterium]